jgi:hypothetical protein
VPDLIFSIEILVALIVAVVGGYLLAVTLRRRAISRGKLLAMCAYAREGSHSWRTGFVRFGEGGVEWYSMGGVSVRPKHAWSRRNLDLGSPVPVGSNEGLDLIDDAVAVPCRDGEARFRLALSRSAYTALRSFVESAPPESASSVN